MSVHAMTQWLTHQQNDFPQLKFAVLAGLGLLALVQRE